MPSRMGAILASGHDAAIIIAVRVAFFTSRMLLGYGVDLVVAELAQRLARDGDEVTVFTTALDGTFAGRGFRLRKLEIPGAAWNRAFFLYERNANRALARLRTAPEVCGLVSQTRHGGSCCHQTSCASGRREAIRVRVRARAQQIGQPRSARFGGARRVLDARRHARLT